jgi:hypothetical protein
MVHTTILPSLAIMSVAENIVPSPLTRGSINMNKHKTTTVTSVDNSM